MSSYSDFANAAARIEEAKGNAIAEGQRQSGAIWGGALGNIGNLIANFPAQQAERQRLQLQAQEQQMRLTTLQRQERARQIIGRGMQTSVNPDGTINVSDLVAAAKQDPDVAASWPDILEGINKAAETTNALKEHRIRGAQLEADQIADFVTQARVAPTPDAQAAVFTKLMQHAASPQIGTLDPQHASDTLAQMLGPDGNPDPAAVTATFDRALRMSSAAKAAQAKLMEPYTLKADERRMIGNTEIVPAGVKPITNDIEAAVRAVAKDPNNPTPAEYKAALELSRQSKGTAEQDDQRYRNIQAALTQRQPVTPDDLAWAKGYEKQKTLGVDTTASAAAQRQATAINAQVQQQGRAQGFQEAQAGRKELTEKVEQPYQTALTSAQTLRDVVASAKAGNKIAANLQNLETTMAAIRAQGLNRINTTEIGVAANAGNLWDRIQGRIGALTAGQAVPPDLQKNMEEFAGILEKSAYAKYKTGFDATTKRYNLADEKPMASPGAPAGGISVQAPNGKTYTFQSQADADAFKAKAGIK